MKSPRIRVVAAFDFAFLVPETGGVLHEIKNVKQERGPGRRRWFESDGLDLIIWFDAGERVMGFQLCYEFGHEEHALTWREGSGFVHAIVDAGDYSPFKNQSPVLQASEGNVHWSELSRLFDAQSESLEPRLRQLVHDKLAERAETNADH